jgi:thiosulfate dehydrogenase [quinone] large subunit
MSTIRKAQMPDPGVVHPEVVAAQPRQERAFGYVAAVTRLALGWVFLWAFLDKTFALGFATGVNPDTGALDRFGPDAWIHGGSPTEGFLAFGTEGNWFHDFYASFAGAAWADWLFMLGLLGIGLTLILGIGMRIGAASGVVLLMLMWSAELPLENNPILDEHVIYALVLIMLVLAGAGHIIGLGKRWDRIPLVARHGWLK